MADGIPEQTNLKPIQGRIFFFNGNHPQSSNRRLQIVLY
jgi:hypothetical protein